MLLLNNVFLIGFHVFTGAKSESFSLVEAAGGRGKGIGGAGWTGGAFLSAVSPVFNTLSDSGACTVIFQVVTALLGSEWDGCVTDDSTKLISSHRVAATNFKSRVPHVNRLCRKYGHCHLALSDLCRY